MGLRLQVEYETLTRKMPWELRRAMPFPAIDSL